VDDIEAIRQLKARYFRTLDTRDWARYRRVFTDDVVVDTTGSGGECITGADAFLQYLGTALEGATTVHQGHMPEITLTSETTAAGVWALHDIVIWPNGVRLEGFGHYHETYVKQDDDWLIASSRLTRLHTDFVGALDGA
jgi:uncharacterized protein (TIGR02246 family)